MAASSSMDTVKKVIAALVLLPVLFVLGMLLFTVMNLFATIIIFLLTLILVFIGGVILWALIEEKFLLKNTAVQKRGGQTTIVVEADNSGTAPAAQTKTPPPSS